MLESFTSGAFEYKRIPVEEQKARGILGRLVGVIADTKNPTRNGRKYSIDLWKHVFDDPVMKEKIANRCLFSELGHPTDREELDPEKICACLAEQPKVGNDGKIYGVFDILDTANGRILKTLCDYGTTVGVSSRGTGDLYTDENGDEAVEPDTYNCECWDIVLVPAVESARMKYVTESLDKKKYNKTLRQRLGETVKRANDSERKAMLESLNKLFEEVNSFMFGTYWTPDGDYPMEYREARKCVLADEEVDPEDFDADPSYYFDQFGWKEVDPPAEMTKDEYEWEKADMINDERRLGESMVVTKGSALEPEREYEVIDVAYDQISGSKVYKVQTGPDSSKWVKESEVKFDLSHQAPVEEEEPAVPVEESVSTEDWTKFVKWANKAGVSKENLNRVYNDLKQHQSEPEVKLEEEYDEFVVGDDVIVFYTSGKVAGKITAEDDMSITVAGTKINKSDITGIKSNVQESLKESLFDDEEELEQRNDFVSLIYHAITKALDKMPSSYRDERITMSMLFSAAEEAVMRLQDEYDIDEDLAHYGADAKASRKSFKRALRALPKGATRADAEREFKDALDEMFTEEECNSEGCADTVVGNAKATGVAAELQEALLKNSQLVKDNLSLQEKLSVCNAKENKLEEDLKRYKSSTIDLSKKVKQSKDLSESLESLKKTNKHLAESLNKVTKKSNELTTQLKEALAKSEESDKANQSLSKEVEFLKENLSQSKQTIKKYQKSMKDAKTKYLNMMAEAYGLNTGDILRNLNESYSYKDIDSTCKLLSERATKLNSLPFKLTENTKINVKGKHEPIRPKSFEDDDVSDWLLGMVK